MTIKDKIILWYLKKIYLPKREMFYYPGFIMENLGTKNIYLREIAIPEDLIINIENKIQEKIAYEIGKKFGWYYAFSSKLPRINEIEKKKFLEYANFLVKYMESVSYGKNLKEKIDYDKKVFHLFADEYIVCKNNGKGYIFGSGGIAGIWAYVTNDKTIEGIQIKCVGKGNKKCEFICAPFEFLKEKGYKPIRYIELEENEIINKEYSEINKIRSAVWAKQSLKSLIDSKIIKYQFGNLIYKNEKFCLVDSLLMYLIEDNIKKIKNCEKILWDCSFDFGRKLVRLSNIENVEKFIQDLFPALGFGDIFIKKEKNKYQIFIRCFPWNKYEIKFIIFRGILSGLLSEFYNKKILLKLIRKKINSEDGFSILIGN